MTFVSAGGWLQRLWESNRLSSLGQQAAVDRNAEEGDTLSLFRPPPPPCGREGGSPPAVPGGTQSAKPRCHRVKETLTPP